MKRRYQLLIIILIGIALTILINSAVIENKITYVAIGDGVSLGMTAYNVVGYSYNDYLVERLDNKNKLQSFNNEYSIQHLTISELNELFEDNALGSKTKIPIKQTIAKGDLLVINIGMDEFIDLSIKNKIDNKRIDKFLEEYELFIKNIRLFYDKDIIIISLYPAYNFNKNLVYEINNGLQRIAVENKTKYLDITAISLNQSYYVDDSSYYMNYQGHKAIYNQLLKITS